MRQFKILDISGDAGITAFGNNLQEVFIHTAIGMYSLITDLSNVKEERNMEISVESYSAEGLLVSWLNELIFHFDTYGFIGKAVNIQELQNRKIRARVCGEDFNPERHERKLLIKAATYHKLRIEKIGDIWEADVVFDI